MYHQFKIAAIAALALASMGGCTANLPQTVPEPDTDTVCSECVGNGGSWQIGECHYGTACPIQDVGCCRVTSRDEALAQGPGFPMEWVGLPHALTCCEDEQDSKQGPALDAGFAVDAGFDAGFAADDGFVTEAGVGADQLSKAARRNCRSPAVGPECHKCCTAELNEESGEYTHCTLHEWDCRGADCDAIKPWYNSLKFMAEPCDEECSPCDPCLERTEDDFDPTPPEGCDVSQCPSFRGEVDACFLADSCACWCQNYESAILACPHLHGQVSPRGTGVGRRKFRDGPGILTRVANLIGRSAD